MRRLCALLLSGALALFAADAPAAKVSLSAEVAAQTWKALRPVAGTYYVIVDNRKGTESRKVRLLIEALRPQPSKSPPKRPDERRLQAT